MNEKIEDVLTGIVFVALVSTLIEGDRRAAFFKRHRWLARLYERIGWDIYELEQEREDLKAARAALLGEEYERERIFAPHDPTIGPAEAIQAAGRSFSETIQKVTGEGP